MPLLLLPLGLKPHSMVFYFIAPVMELIPDGLTAPSLQGDCGKVGQEFYLCEWGVAWWGSVPLRGRIKGRIGGIHAKK